MTNKKIIEKIFNRVKDMITAGMKVETQRATLPFLREIINDEVELYKEEPAKMKAAIFEEFIRSLFEKTKNLNPEERQRFILKEYFGSCIRPLDRQAYYLAKTYHKEGDTKGMLRQQAEKVLSSITKIADEIKEKNLYLRFAMIISEIIMDCNYVIGGGKVASLRMGRILSKESKK